MASPVGIAATSALGPVTDMARQLANAASPVQIPEPGTLIEAFTQRRLTRQGLNQWLTLHGIISSPESGIGTTLSDSAVANLARLWDVALGTQWAVPTVPDSFALVNRGIVDPSQLGLLMDRNKIDPVWRNALAQLRDAIPGAGDLVTFLVRDVWSPDVIRRFGYDQEYPAELERWLGAQGLAWTIPSPTHEAAGLGPFNWSKAYWWSHWQLPSPTQGTEMVHRLRGTLKDPAVPRDPSGLFFTPDDLRLLLKTADYPVYWRDRLQAIGYRPIGIRNLRALYRNGLVDETGVAEVFLDQGFNRRDALIQARLVATEQDTTDLLAARKTGRQQTIAAYQLGILNADQFVVALYRLRLKTPAAVTAFNDLPEGVQFTTALGDSVVTTTQRSLDLQSSVQRVKQLVASIRSRFLKRQLTGDAARQALQALDLDPKRVQQWLIDWTAELSSFAKLSSPGMVVRWFRRGLMGANEAGALLLHWGYDQQQADLIMTEANLDMVGKQARVLSSLAAAGHRVGRQLAQAVAAQQKQLRQAQSALARSASLSALRRFALEGLIDGRDYATRLANLGVSGADLSRYLAETAAGRQKAAEKAAAAIARSKAAADRQAAKSPRSVPIATLRKWLKKGVLAEADFRSRAGQLGYSAADVDRFVKGG